MRLLLTAADDGSITGGIEIVLEPGWYTYWRNPGEAGVPPVFDFRARRMSRTIEVLYPAPSARTTAASVSLIYQRRGGVSAGRDAWRAPACPSRFVWRRASASAARSASRRERASEVALSPPTDSDPLSEERLSSFEERVPRKPEPGTFDIEEVARDGDALDHRRARAGHRPIPTSSPIRPRAGISASRRSSSGLTEYPAIGSRLPAGPATPR